MKLDHHSIEEMMKILNRYQLEELSYEGEQGKITLTAASGVKEKKKERSKQREREKADISKYVISEGIGKYFFLRENGKAYIEVGEELKVGDTIGYVTSIGISTPLISKFSGVIEEILVKNGDVIDYGKKLIKIQE
ncbi:biotin/lipoyl-containing protein [Fusobacterium necrophorum]|uniref:biotin/lipoyl-containing protein n=1 Tax=Fusobacterium necrophorum TaxID=859 RepID=UPI003FA03997